MAPAGILHHFDQGQHVLIIVFPMQRRHRISIALQRPGGGHIQRMFDPVIQFARTETLEIGALAPSTSWIWI